MDLKINSNTSLHFSLHGCMKTLFFCLIGIISNKTIRICWIYFHLHVWRGLQLKPFLWKDSERHSSSLIPGDACHCQKVKIQPNGFCNLTQGVTERGLSLWREPRDVPNIIEGQMYSIIRTQTAALPQKQRSSARHHIAIARASGAVATW